MLLPSHFPKGGLRGIMSLTTKDVSAIISNRQIRRKAASKKYDKLGERMYNKKIVMVSIIRDVIT